MKSKNIKIIFFLALGLILQNPKSTGQCILEIGNDTTFCVNELDSGNTPFLNVLPQIQNGTPPYQYKWETEYWAFGTIFSSASYFFDDTTSANPNLLQSSGTDDWITMNLTVTDALGQSCNDSLRIRFSEFAWSFANEFHTINQGDTVQLSGLNPIFGGIPPYEFTLSPSIGLSNPNDLNTLAFPDTSTTYSLSAIDSVGCASNSFPVFFITVSTTSAKKLNKKEDIYTVFPNPVSEELAIIFLNLDNLNELKIKFYAQNGQLVISKEIKNNETKINVKSLKSGLYTYILEKDNKAIRSGKIVKN